MVSSRSMTDSAARVVAAAIVVVRPRERVVAATRGMMRQRRRLRNGRYAGSRGYDRRAPRVVAAFDACTADRSSWPLRWRRAGAWPRPRSTTRARTAGRRKSCPADRRRRRCLARDAGAREGSRDPRCAGGRGQGRRDPRPRPRRSSRFRHDRRPACAPRRRGLCDACRSRCRCSPPGATRDDYSVALPAAAERIAAAIAFLRAKEIAQIAIVSHSVGATMTDAYLARPRVRRDRRVGAGRNARRFREAPPRAGARYRRRERIAGGRRGGAAAGEAAAARRCSRQLTIAGCGPLFRERAEGARGGDRGLSRSRFAGR